MSRANFWRLSPYVRSLHLSIEGSSVLQVGILHTVSPNHCKCCSYRTLALQVAEMKG